MTGLSVSSALAKAEDSLSAKIEKLIAAVGESNCQFHRNGKTYSSEASVEHIRKKYRYYKDDIDSIDKFIELSATKSMMSGKPYKILCEDNEAELSKSWMTNKAVAIGVSE
jgi:hypothetical protein